MFHLNHAINFPTLSPPNIISTPSVYRHLTASKKHQQARRQRTTTTTTATTIITKNTATTISLFSVNTTIIPSFFSSTSSTQQQVSFEDSYSAKTGIKTAALLGGMLFFVIVYLLWKARARLCRPSRSSIGAGGSARPSVTKFDLDYWLKQVDLLEIKEAERNRGDQSIYLELPTQEPRDNQQATASWIVDTWRQWRLVHYRRQQHFSGQSVAPQTVPSSPPVPYRRRRHVLRRLVRRLLTAPRQDSSLLMDNSLSMMAGMRPSAASITPMPQPLMLDGRHRRAASWPRLRPSHHQTGTMMSALQTHLARQRLLKRTSRTTFDT